MTEISLTQTLRKGIYSALHRDSLSRTSCANVILGDIDPA